ncbi:hypothetical protein DOTSEDRAFT_70481 [Dothistroma septosporum NZE10]|uniref:Uncharacterized protein n=1 Tax=Dothistroma septosporum (strain NZE10 / CBS 128990) TaxID=675120 RepID=N1PSQ6_DOTSN|nr:hypothetical protein DOTSEDRAFT_70481 [Dothistroma septosporum NZE10]
MKRQVNKLPDVEVACSKDWRPRCGQQTTRSHLHDPSAAGFISRPACSTVIGSITPPGERPTKRTRHESGEDTDDTV